MALFARKSKRNDSDADPSAAGDGPIVDRRSTTRAPDPLRPHVQELTVADYVAGMPRVRVLDFLHGLKRQLPWAVALFILGTVAAWYVTKDFKRTYSGEGRILVQIGPEYIYDPVAGQAAGGLLITPDHIVQNEVGVIRSGEVLSRVIGEMSTDLGQATFAPDAYDKINATREGTLARREAVYELRKSVEDSFAVMPQAKSSIIDLAFKHENPDVAVATLNAFIDAYIAERKELFVEGSADIIGERRAATEAQLDANARQISRFLERNDISDFDSERAGVTDRTERLRASLNALRGDLTEAEGALSTVETQLRATNPEIDLYVDDRTSQRIAQAELELKQLLAKYLPASEPVRRKQVEIAEMRSLQAARGGRASGGRRVGPNPVFQELQTRRNTLAAQADSLREKEFILQRQLNSADAKTRRLRNLSPQYANLLRERDTLSARLRALNTREQEALVNQQQAEAATENVRVISRAELPRKGRNIALLALVIATIAWAGLLFLFALLRVFLDPRLIGRSGPVMRAPIPGSAPPIAAPPTKIPPASPTIPEPVEPMRPTTPDDPPPFAEPAPVYAHDPYAHEQAVATGAAPNPPSRNERIDPDYDMSQHIAQVWTPPESAALTPATYASLERDIALPPMPGTPQATGNPYLTMDVAQAFQRH